MSNTVMVKPIRPYMDDARGWQEPESPAYPVSPTRASELKANGLVQIDDGEDHAAKAAAPAPNKMAPAPANKAVDALNGKK